MSRSLAFCDSHSAEFYRRIAWTDELIVTWNKGIEYKVGEPWPPKPRLAHMPVAAAPSCGERNTEPLLAYNPGPFPFQAGSVLVTLQREVCHMLLCSSLFEHHLSHGVTLAFTKPTNCLEHAIYFHQKQFLGG